MKNIDLKLVCEPVNYKAENVRVKWLEKEIGICIPFGRRKLTEDKDKTTIRCILEYIRKKPPHITSLRFCNLQGGEPSYIKVTPTLERQDEKVWDLIYKLWPGLIKKLIGKGNSCYFQPQILSADLYTDYLPKDYKGRIIKSFDDDMPVLIECTSSFLDLAEQNPSVYLRKSAIWDYATFGYVLPKGKEYKLKNWATASKCTSEIVKDFFESIVCYFEVKYECEGIWIVSHKMDWQTIYNIVDVDKVNRDLNHSDM